MCHRAEEAGKRPISHASFLSRPAEIRGQGMPAAVEGAWLPISAKALQS